MFNSIRKDDNCRKLVKSLEILRLQNKIIVQAMSEFEQVEKKEFASRQDVAFFDNANIKSNAIFEHKKPSLLSSVSSKPLNSSLQNENEKLSTIFFTKGNLPLVTTPDQVKGKLIGYGNKKSIPSFAIAVNNDKTNNISYNYNCFTGLELSKSSLHLFAKKRVKVENENKITNSSTFPKVKDNNKSSLSKKNVSYSSSLLSLAKGRILSLPRNSSKSRIKNRCIETGRSHSVLRFCKLSRIRLRDNASKALIPGISKASW